ncbi:MAG: NUDIX domain-containing protein [Aquirhabdus sp.]
MTTYANSKNKKTLGFDLPLTTVDIVIFAVVNEQLSVLLIKRNSDANEPYPDQWALPGGFINVAIDKSLQDCALRKLSEKTGLNNAYLEQLGSWGNSSRDPRGWSSTHAYFSLIAADVTGTIQSGANAVDVKWANVVGDKLKDTLAFDHNQIVCAAIERLRNKVEYTSLPAFLVSKEFTLSELQKTYEIVLGRKLDKSAFRTRILSAKLVEEVPRYRAGSNRPAQLYTLKSLLDPVIFQRTFKPLSSNSK